MLSFRKSPRLLQEKRGTENNNNLSSVKHETIANSNSSGNIGDIRFDGNFIYVCIAKNSWKRATLAAF